MNEVELIALIIVLVGISGFFSMAETSLTSYKYIDFIEDEKRFKESKRIVHLKAWIDDPNKFLTGILIANNMVNILATAVFTTFIDDVLSQHFHLNPVVDILISTMVMTVMLLFLSEITPKIFAKKSYKKLAPILITPTVYAVKLLSPLIFLFIIASQWSLRLFGIKIDEKHSLITEHELRSMVSIGEEEGIIEAVEKEMINSIFEFGDKTVREVMIPRSYVFGVDVEENMVENIENINRSGYSRVPIYGDNLDNIIGIVHVKNLLKLSKIDDAEVIKKEILSLLHKPYFIPENMNLMTLLNEFKTRRLHFACVVDEYGSTVGVITLEDLVEEIVGDIQDETDEHISHIKQVHENKFIIDPVVSIETINEVIKLHIPESSDYTTFAGYLLYKIQKIPEKNEEFQLDNFKVKILSIRNHRIFQVRLLKL